MTIEFGAAWPVGLPVSVHDLTRGEMLAAAEFRGLIGARSAGLAVAGLRPGGVALLSTESPITMLADIFATWSLNAGAAVLDHSYSMRERSAFAAFLTPDVEVDATGAVTPSPHAPPAVVADSGEAVPALLLATSGTTGAPKFVALSQAAVQARLAANLSTIGVDTLARTLVALPLSFGHGLIGNCLSACAAGGSVTFMDRSLSGLLSLGRVIDENRISFLSSVPSFWRMALRGQRPTGQSLQRVHVGSAPLGPEHAAAIANWCAPAALWNCYGITETANWIAGQHVDAGFAANRIGQAFTGTSLAVMHEDGSVSPYGEGEILVRSDGLMTGYFRAPIATSAALDGGWFHTGDIGRITDTGTVIIGRLKDEVNVAGFKVNPGEVDLVLAAHPAVAEACAYGRPDLAAGEVIAAAVTLKPGHDATPADLIAHAAQNLRRIAVPASVTIMDEIPLTARGKISRTAVRDRIEGGNG